METGMPFYEPIIARAHHLAKFYVVDYTGFSVQRFSILRSAYAVIGKITPDKIKTLKSAKWKIDRM